MLPPVSLRELLCRIPPHGRKGCLHGAERRLRPQPAPRPSGGLFRATLHSSRSAIPAPKLSHWEFDGLFRGPSPVNFPDGTGSASLMRTRVLLSLFASRPALAWRTRVTVGASRAPTNSDKRRLAHRGLNALPLTRVSYRADSKIPIVSSWTSGPGEPPPSRDACVLEALDARDHSVHRKSCPLVAHHTLGACRASRRS